MSGSVKSGSARSPSVMSSGVMSPGLTSASARCKHVPDACITAGRATYSPPGRRRPIFLGGLLLASLLASSQASALNILLSNDDGYRHPNIRALYTALKAAGHRVKIAAPEGDQSARGGSFLFGREVTIGQDSDPAFPDSYYVATREQGLCASPECAGKPVSIAISGTPVMAVLMGLSKVMPKPDLIIVGPNPGNNLGAINSASGTYNAAGIGVQAGIPTLAVSNDLKEQDTQGVARVITRLVDALDHHRQPDGALLPPGIGLNINLPPLDQIKGLKQTQVGSYVGFEPVWTNNLAKLFPQQAGKAGISFQSNQPPTEAEQDNEAVWVAKGYVTVSPFEPAPARVAIGTALQPLIDAEQRDLVSGRQP